MKIQLKPIDEQVMVITGASSGIGLATARRAARNGARLVLAARSDEALRELVDEIRREGGQAVHVEGDVGSEADVQRLGEEARRAFGRIDTWVNNAGASVYGWALEVPVEDMRRVFETNFWGVVYGSRVACAHMRQGGGALINIGSETSDRGIPLQAIYSASKYAVKGWTEALRTELMHQRVPISVTLIKPGPIDTPFTEHARNYLEDQPKHAPPVYAPESVARAILYAATTPVRDLFVGSGAQVMSSLNAFAPRVSDAFVEKTVIPGTHSGRPRQEHDALFEPGGGLKERGDYEGLVRQSLYTEAVMHPLVTGAVAFGAGLLMTSLWRSATRREGNGWTHEPVSEPPEIPTALDPREERVHPVRIDTL